MLTSALNYMGFCSTTHNPHIVIAGNPGVGKSAILNCIIGRPVFESGIALGTGLTSALNTVKISGITYSDTPGLDDVNIRQKAADEISKAFQGGGCFKLIFVVTLEAGRIKPADKATIKVILDAIDSAGVDTKFGYAIIVNKCDDGVLEALKETEDRARLELQFGKGSTVNHIGYMPVVPEAVGKRNAMLTGKERYSEFIAASPTIEIPADSTVQVRVAEYDAVIEVLREELSQLREQLDSVLQERSRTGGPVRRFLTDVGDAVVGVLENLYEHAADAFLFL